MSDLASPAHNCTTEVEQAAMWLADQRPAPSPIIPALRQRFGLSTIDACKAAALSEKFRIYRRAHG